ncbi:MAG: methyltransferase domain-containing protein [Anaerolineae bacterium]|nr:methyltransferase domain-containing protein [Anaerolineae bacterium]
MVAHWANLDNTCVLDHGGGNGMYAAQIRKRYTPHVEVFDIESARAHQAKSAVPHALVAAAEFLPYRSNLFDAIVSNEVIEHVADDHAAAAEIVRVLKPGGRAVIFVPNRWYPFETHGHYWRGIYHFGNTPLINYLPDALRNRLAPHVRAYTKRSLRRLFDGLPVSVLHHSRIYGGYDNIIARFGPAGRIARNILHGIEGTPLDTFGLSHLLVIEKSL